ncbi:MAG TPA: LemA family protein [Candidatus Diapherotrites archaeon]|uniref:LemA family protein n=1 Tax=Candidatus Iainarchaeum sp. TaxID=3101447 RepID=A0A7J4IXD9_9ARCH|nr:LemA family protein [Candidatus Diapherotrites archaeon]
MVELLVWGIIGVIGVVILWFVLAYNGLIQLRNRIDNAWSQIDVQLKRRFDLVPNLVETVKGYAKHEKETLKMVTEARATAMKAGSVKEKESAENMLTGALKTLFAVSESYPDLKANQNFLMLQEELAGIESKIAYARQFYNDMVLDYNNRTQMMPDSIIAGMFGFGRREFFQTQEAERANVKVQF